MEIHFYEGTPFPKDCYHTWWDTRSAIVMKRERINTTQMGYLSTDLIDAGYKVFLGGKAEIKLGANECTGREIKVEHNLFNLWKAGEFNG